MDNVTFFDVEQSDKSVITFAMIDIGNGEFISMPKSVYDAQQVEHLTEIIPADEA